ncbi:C4-dicarboxylate ABC transporter permease [Zobellella denitrificans]|uniref:TRAP transporter small permease protein n=1 Tax=Zobellella denitrificans TaxID=347534 RepID=A0A291HRY5_9GAMM|nr:TRAP transporter small permease [Zobellella denitrificans]ATG74933.1 C4-dicarboxylate ABC transporter permease [Zobellella denitrificans]
MLKRISDRVASVEMTVAALLAGAVTLLVLLNIVTRAMGQAIYWVDELAIYCMVWMTFISTSAVLKKRRGVAVTILTDQLPTALRRWLTVFSDLMILGFALALFVLCWRWYSPLALMQAGFDFQAFQSETFNFMYAENTNTLGIKKFWVWLVLPVFSLSLGIHALLNLFDSLSGSQQTMTGEPT